MDEKEVTVKELIRKGKKLQAREALGSVKILEKR